MDAEFLEREFVPVFNRYDLMQLPNFTACISTLVNGQVSRPFTMQKIMDTVSLDQKRSNAIREFSCKKYGKPRHRVEDEIAESLIFTPVKRDAFNI